MKLRTTRMTASDLAVSAEFGGPGMCGAPQPQDIAKAKTTQTMRRAIGMIRQPSRSQRKASLPVKAWPNTSWCISGVPS